MLGKGRGQNWLLPGQYQQILVAEETLLVDFCGVRMLVSGDFCKASGGVMSRLKAELVVHSLKMKENVPKQSVEIHTNKPVDIQSQR